MKKICPNCGKRYDSGKFCTECGAKLQDVVPEMTCPNCGYKTKTGKFCPECGTRLVEQQDDLVSVPSKEEGPQFNEHDPRLAKYYDEKGFPRTFPKEELSVVTEQLSAFVEQNVPEAKMLLGNALLTDPSDGVAVAKAVNLLKEAESAGDKFAYYLLGGLYAMDCEPLLKYDEDEGEKRLLEPNREFPGEAADCLAELYMRGTKKRDFKKAFQYATIAADNDEENGYLVLGYLSLNGWGCEKNVQDALDNFKMAAADGNGEAMNQIGFIYMDDQSGERNPEQAFFWFNEAAQKGFGMAWGNLGICYQTGLGVTQDYEKAAECFKKAAGFGDVNAMASLGAYYQYVLKDDDKSKSWYLKAAEQGNPEAQNSLGELYANANEPDYAEAIKWYKEAMAQNNAEAYKNYAQCLWFGNGVNVDQSKAIETMQKAVDLGLAEAEEHVKAMIESVSPDILRIDEGTEKLMKLSSPANNKNWKSEVKTVFLPATLTGIKKNIFDELPNLERIVSPEGYFDKYAKMLPYDWWRMYYKDGSPVCLEVTFPERQTYVYPYGKKEILKDAYANGHVLIPPTCKSIARSAFAFNKRILSVTMMDSVTSIGDSAFSNCEKLQSVRFSRKLKVIPESVLTTCGAITEIEIPEGVTVIEADAFTNCKSLKKIILPSTIKRIDRGGAFGFNPFQLDEALKSIVVPKGKIKKFRSLLMGFGDDPASLLVEDPTKDVPVKKPAKSQKSSAVKTRANQYSKRGLPMDEIQRAANASYAKPSLKALAYAALRIAEVIEENIPNADVSYMVHPSEFDSTVSQEALPIHFLFRKNGVPRVAVVAVTAAGFNTPLVQETQEACESNNIAYVRVYATGTFADWLEPDAEPEKIEFCNNWLVRKISENL